ncbi:RNA polymerase sigma factor [Nocardioides sp. J9]|uniref:RNA polymerase sigma factor n=1 Tax=Nocardioides sp. J9 TaxID=935844 RepID=UPI0021BD3EB0|nr:sigma-70 family RNA polymerase sigma factor [Nocardioides sp. J9]
MDESHVALVAALRQLPEAQRQALVLHHIADLPVQQVAAEVGVPEGTIKARLSRGRAALAELLADDAGLAGGGVSHA